MNKFTQIFWKSSFKTRSDNSNFKNSSSEFEKISGKKAVIVCSSGGHLQEAILLIEKLKVAKDSLIVTHETPQSISLLANRNHLFVPQIKSRDWLGTFKAVPKLAHIFRDEECDLVISTGAAISLSAVPGVIRYRRKYLYFESLTRFHRPSLSGRVLALSSTVNVFSPFAKNFGGKWRTSPSILDEYTRAEKVESETKRGLRILVTLGTIPNYRFDRLIDYVLSILKPEDQVYWQVGSTLRSNLPGIVYTHISNDGLLEIARQCDVVIAHCGIGTLLDLFSIGVSPMICPRTKASKEHVDDHQIEASRVFLDLDLVTLITSTTTRNDLENVAHIYIKRTIAHPNQK